MINNLTPGQFLVPLLIGFHNAPMIAGQFLTSLIENGDCAPDDASHDFFDTEPTIGIKQRTALRETN